jgi:molybdenum cofactor synthesis domain-containing protein
MISVAIITVSDRCFSEQQEDLSGPAIREALPETEFEVRDQTIVPDEEDMIAGELVRISDEVGCDVIFTTGGTGFGPRDVTPEATAAVCTRLIPGISEAMRSEGLAKTRKAMLSRGIAGIRGGTLIINLPGSPKAVRESLETILSVLPHAIEMMHGGGH